jgi:hypothetical protein
MATWGETPLSRTWQLGAIAILLLVVFIDGQVLAPTRGSLYIFLRPRSPAPRSLLQAAPPRLAVEVQSPTPGAWYATGDSSSIPLRVRVSGGDISASGLAVTRACGCMCVHVWRSGRGPKCAGDDGDGGVRAHR